MNRRWNGLVASVDRNLDSIKREGRSPTPTF